VHDTRTGHLKTALVFPLFLAAVGVLVGRLYAIQVCGHEDFLALARKQSETTVKLEATRGSIVDCNGTALALTIKIPAVFADPGVASVPPKVRTWLPQALGVPPAEFKKFLATQPELFPDVNDPNLERIVEVTRRLAEWLRRPEQELLGRLLAAVEARRAEVTRKVAPLLNLPEEGVRQALSRDARFVWLKRPVDDATARQIQALALRGVCVTDLHARTAASGLMTGPWLGFVWGEGRGLDWL